MKIKKIKRKLANKNWVEERLNFYIDKTQYWYNFNMFNCDRFHVGHYAAERNKIIYKKAIHRIERHINFLKQILKKI